MSGIRPDTFQEETNPTDSNFEVYGQKAGNSRRARLSNLKRFFLAVVYGAVNYTPNPIGNTDNRGEFITDPSGVNWYIDADGKAIKLGGQPNKLHEYLGLITGATIVTTITLPSNGKEWRIELYRSGSRLTYGQDFSSTTNTITLEIAADAEPFTLIVIPE